MTQGLLYYCHIEAMLRLLHKHLITARISVICTFTLSVVFPLTELSLCYDIHQMYDGADVPYLRCWHHRDNCRCLLAVTRAM